MLLFPSLLLAGLLPALCSAATPKLDKYRQLARKHNGLIPLDAAQYDELTSSPRDYSVSVVLTAMGSQYKCIPCHTLQPEYQLLAKQWNSAKKQDGEDHFFAYLDFATAPTIFQRLGLQTAPTFQLWMPTEGSRAANQLGPEGADFGRSNFQAEAIASYLKTTAKLPSLAFSRPVDKSKVVKTAVLALGTVIGVYQGRSYIRVVFSQTYIWAGMTIIVILLMTSGYMWNQIRRPLYSQAGRNGQVTYIAGGYQSQLGAETHIVAGIYGVLGFSTYALAHIIPKLNDPVRQRLGIYVWTGVYIIMVGVLINVFQIKQPGYPFRIF
ncbi:dolichyl-diphosphooligosaccharide--protein glycotransferase OST3 [Sporobolomyces salmoneus]|uniref:dolichyl-diphosphooligosaccharide--protein glycotransferase OST3 n=1 Tax=Sporobolomyces salmoneus TaxID=183962 RepID=UPI00317A3BC9